jgi:phospholipid/cholesterol/gamma-HCH transport system substrate-binding protein
MNRTLTSLHRMRLPLAGVALFTVVSVVLTLLVAGTLAKGGTGDAVRIKAVFRDATGLRSGDDVRIAGVRVGEVKRVSLQGSHALVELVVDKRQPVYDTTAAKIDYLNLMGQRYVALSMSGKPGRRLASGATIPLGRTQEGLDLNAMFNAFKPLFQMIRPEDVNQLASNVVQVLQGEGGALQELTAQTARLTSTLSDRDQVIGAVIENLGAVMRNLRDHRPEITAMVDRLDTLTGTVAHNTAQIAAAIDGTSALASSFTDLLDGVGPSVDADVQALRGWADSFADQSPRLGQALTDTQVLLKSYIKTLGIGSYLDTYVCKSSLQLGQTGPVLPLDVSNQHSRRCQ